MGTKKTTTKKSASKTAAKPKTCNKSKANCGCNYKKANEEYDKSFRAVCLAIVMAGLLAINGAIMVGVTIGNSTSATTSQNTVHYEGPIFDEDEEEIVEDLEVAE